MLDWLDFYIHRHIYAT